MQPLTLANQRNWVTYGDAPLDSVPEAVPAGSQPTMLPPMPRPQPAQIASRLAPAGMMAAAQAGGAIPGGSGGDIPGHPLEADTLMHLLSDPSYGFDPTNPGEAIDFMDAHPHLHDMLLHDMPHGPMGPQGASLLASRPAQSSMLQPPSAAPTRGVGPLPMQPPTLLPSYMQQIDAMLPQRQTPHLTSRFERGASGIADALTGLGRVVQSRSRQNQRMIPIQPTNYSAQIRARDAAELDRTDAANRGIDITRTQLGASHMQHVLDQAAETERTKMTQDAETARAAATDQIRKEIAEGKYRSAEDIAAGKATAAENTATLLAKEAQSYGDQLHGGASPDEVRTSIAKRHPDWDAADIDAMFAQATTLKGVRASEIARNNASATLSGVNAGVNANKQSIIPGVNDDAFHVADAEANKSLNEDLRYKYRKYPPATMNRMHAQAVAGRLPGVRPEDVPDVWTGTPSATPGATLEGAASAPATAATQLDETDQGLLDVFRRVNVGETTPADLGYTKKEWDAVQRHVLKIIIMQQEQALPGGK